MIFFITVFLQLYYQLYYQCDTISLLVINSKEAVMSLVDTVIELCEKDSEQEWFEFKENWFEPVTLGEYVSALSNAAAYCLKDTAYLVWGIEDKTHAIVGTTFDYYCNYKNQPFQNYLAINLSPSIDFEFDEVVINGKRVVVLSIPAAHNVPTSFANNRFIRIGSSKVNLRDYPDRERKLFRILDRGISTIENTPADYQNLTFRKLFGYYGSRGIALKEKTFEENLELRTKEGRYNIMAQLLSDNSHIPFRVSIFKGTSKGSDLFSVREFGNNCLLYTLDEVLRYGDVLNIIQADEKDRVVERKDVPLFDNNAFREAVINAVLHNLWVEGNEPMISVFSDRIEILSRGPLPPKQTLEGFFRGQSVPVNRKLSEIFLQLHISEKSGRGVPKIVEVYGRNAFSIEENAIVVIIPFNRLNSKDSNRRKKKPMPLSDNRKKIISEMLKNPGITKAELQRILEISDTAVDNNISYLKKSEFIYRIGSNKTGYWHVSEKALWEDYENSGK